MEPSASGATLGPMWFAFPFLVPPLLWGLLAGQPAPPCRDVQHLGERYEVCSFDPAFVRVSMHLYDPGGVPYRGLRNLRRSLGEPLMAMNGGMYRDDLSPVGLYVERGEEVAPIVLNDGWGNFHLLPNGVFHVSEGKDGAQTLGVTESRAFAADPPPNVVHATQSGPMLVIDGALHPRFLPRSDSLKLRNGVGVSADGHVHFAISVGRVRFHDFGTLFRDVLQTPNALFLDGTISAFEAGNRRRFTFAPLGPMIRVTAREEEAGADEAEESEREAGKDDAGGADG